MQKRGVYVCGSEVELDKGLKGVHACPVAGRDFRNENDWASTTNISLRILSKLGGMIFLVIPLLVLLFLVEKEKQRNGVLTSVHSSLLLPGGADD